MTPERVERIKGIVALVTANFHGVKGVTDGMESCGGGYLEYAVQAEDLLAGLRLLLAVAEHCTSCESYQFGEKSGWCIDCQFIELRRIADGEQT